MLQYPEEEGVTEEDIRQNKNRSVILPSLYFTFFFIPVP